MQRVLQAATAENDNPDIRDRAYVYWRLLSSDQQVTRNVVLADRPPIATTIKSLPPALLDELLLELSTLASVYHKPPAAFLGQGRFASDAVQKAAIEEQMQNARENPLAAAAAAAAVTGGEQAQENIENLLDFDADGSMPASMQKQAAHGGSGLEGLTGTPMRVASPDGEQGIPNAVDDLAGIFGNGTIGDQAQQIPDDLMNGFATMSMEQGFGSNQPPPPGQQLHGGQKSNKDLLDLF